MDKSKTLGNVGFDLYTGIFTHYKNVSKLSTARHILKTNKDVTLLRYTERDGTLHDERKETLGGG